MDKNTVDYSEKQINIYVFITNQLFYWGFVVCAIINLLQHIQNPAIMPGFDEKNKKEKWND